VSAPEENKPDQKRIVAALAKKSQVPVDEVAQLYERTHAELSIGAHITKFLHILTLRNVQETLRKRGSERLASPQERARIDAMLVNILPVSLRAQGLRSDTAAGKHLSPAPLESIRLPTLVISARDDRYGTFASAKYTADRISGAKFINFDEGGHTRVGHDDEVRAVIVALLMPSAGR